MKKRLALAAVSAATLAIMAGPAALTVAAQDTDTDVRVETGWMKHGKEFKGRGHAFGRLRLLGEAEHPRKERGDRDDEDEDRRKDQRGIFKELRNADLSATETAQVRAAIEVKQTSLLGAMKAKMEATIAAMEVKNADVLAAWEIEDKDERNTALETVREEAKEDRTEIRTTFRTSVRLALETFTAAITSILGL